MNEAHNKMPRLRWDRASGLRVVESYIYAQVNERIAERERLSIERAKQAADQLRQDYAEHLEKSTRPKFRRRLAPWIGIPVGGTIGWLIVLLLRALP